MSGLDNTKYYTRKFLGIPQPTETKQDRISRGESVASTYVANAYVAPPPTVQGYIREITPSRSDVRDYFKSLLPFIEWLPRYNNVWLLGDLVAGITVGAVVVPQGMAYAKLANLPPEYGLYSSFVGVTLYWFFATSKDITIGPVAVMSLLTGHIITAVQAKHKTLTGPEIANALALLAGSFVFVLGVLRLGFIVDFIPLPAIAAFMTGSALNIAIGQLAGLLGQTGYDTRAATYKVFINFLKYLPKCNVNAAMGLTALFGLYFIRWICGSLAKRNPSRAKLWFFISTLRTAFIILLFVMVSWLVNRHHKTKPTFSILGTVPRGFKHMGVPVLNHTLVSSIAPFLPGAIIVLLIEHIAISKSFGRVNNYVINPSQELIAIGVTNIFGPFFGAYPATGSFSRTAIKSKAGVRTPIAGLITAAVVILAIYALPPVFFYIPNASLSAVIIHAVGDLITPPKAVYQFWQVSPAEVVIFFAGVLGTVFGTIEIGIYTAIASTAGLLLYRIAKAQGEFLGRIRAYGIDGYADPRNVFVPLNHNDGSNPRIPVEAPIPGVFIYRVKESVLYPNVNHYTDELVAYIFAHTKRTNPQSYPRLGDRPWNLPGPRHVDSDDILRDHRPTLRALILDFTAVDHLDVTSVQNLIDVRGQLDRHASPDFVEWHFAGISSAWVRRALIAGGFGHPAPDAKPLFSVADVTGANDFKTKEEVDYEQHARDEENDPASRHTSRLPVISLDRQAFHLDVEAALAFVEARLGNLGSTSSIEKPSADAKTPAHELS